MMRNILFILLAFFSLNIHAQVVVFGINVTPGTPVPTITVSPSSLSGFETDEGTASTSQSFTVSGSNLTDDIGLKPPAGYEISFSSGSGYADTLTVTETDGTVSSTTVYARIKSTASAGSVSGNVACTSPGASTKNIAVSGTVTEPATPTLTVSVSSLDEFSTEEGTPSSSKTFTVSGANLTNNVLITAPTYYQVSLDDADWGDSKTITKSGTTLPDQPVTVYARVGATATEGTPGGNIVVSSTGASSKNVAVTSTVTEAEEPAAYDTIQVNLYGSAGGAISDAAWNDWNPTSANSTSSALSKSTGASTSITATLSIASTYTQNTPAGTWGSDNTVGFPTGAFNYTMFNNSNSSGNLVFNNCGTHTYKLLILCSRTTTTDYEQKFSYGGTDYNIEPRNNISTLVEIDNITPSSGTITIPFSRVTGSFLFLTAFKLIDKTP